VILPGMLAIGLHASRGGFLPIGSDGQPNYNLAIPMMLAHYMQPDCWDWDSPR